MSSTPSPTSLEPLLAPVTECAAELCDLTVETAGGLKIVDDVSLCVPPGAIVALVGESGSGKTTVGLSLLGYAKPGATIRSGRVRVGQADVPLGDERECRKLRGRLVAYVPQDPSSTLTPSIRIGAHVREAGRVHGIDLGAEDVAALFERVALPAESRFLRRFPHELSGGQRQRVVIAMALSCDPDVIVFDEPTTALDAVTQARILELVSEVAAAGSRGALYISHDLGVVRAVADRVAVMYAGRIVESGPTADLLRNPWHPYTKALIGAAPVLSAEQRHLSAIPGVAPRVGTGWSECAFADRCRFATSECRRGVPELRIVNGRAIRCVHFGALREAETSPTPRAMVTRVTGATVALEVSQLTARYRNSRRAAVSDVSLEVRSGECLAVVGESGSGKSTLARCICGLVTPVHGTISLHGRVLAPSVRARGRDDLRDIGIVFQNPDTSLNPRKSVEQIVGRAASQADRLGGREREQRVRQALEDVRLDPDLRTSYPRDLSGGERQRVSIARALAMNPSVLVCDEITSALDVSVQAAVIELLRELRNRRQLTIVMISHDISVVSAIAESAVVMKDGAVVESGALAGLLERPFVDYTKTLIRSVQAVALTEQVDGIRVDDRR
jgi:peptide/nickel transport system ATP-binding protein